MALLRYVDFVKLRAGVYAGSSMPDGDCCIQAISKKR
jgi:hypothetical protein